MTERGFTLIETLIAIAILTVGIVGVGVTLAVQTSGVASSLPFGQAAVTRGYYVSTAAMLAQERLEQAKRLQYVIGPPAVDELAASPPTGFADEDYGQITGYANFKRQVRVTAAAPAANMKTITVTVTYKLPREASISEESLTIGTIIAARP